ncbi:hypothetical protein GQ44DRAFT_770026 [Phaeosphaeriaceae sp. PMI808]|nr:hypothetical protein GQ44DRAFT_770026 [Phaeosphaeriaceae sp. PMI808]
MSDKNAKGKGRGGSGGGWNEHEVLVYLLSAIEYSNAKIDYANAPAPAGRNPNGCSQKMNKIKIALRAEIDAIKNGGAAEPQTKDTPKKAAGRKRKSAAVEDDSDISPKKRERTKSASAEGEDEIKVTCKVKEELEE